MTKIPSLVNEEYSPNYSANEVKILQDNNLLESMLKPLLHGQNKVNSYGIKQFTPDSGQFDELDQFKPIKPDLNVLFHPETKPDFDLDSLLGKLNKLISTSTTIVTPKTAVINSNTYPDETRKIENEISTLSPSQSQDENSSEITTIFGPVSIQTTQIPIIGPLNTPKLHSESEQGETSRLNTLTMDGYDLISLNKIEAPLHSILDKFNNTLSTEMSARDFNNSSQEFINREITNELSYNSDDVIKAEDKSNDKLEDTSTSTTKKRIFPWPINHKKNATSASTVTLTSDKLEDYNPVLTTSTITTTTLASSSNTDISTRPTTAKTTVKQNPARTTMKRPIFPTVNLNIKTKKPRIPYWMANILAILPSLTTPKPLHRSTKSLFPMKSTKSEQVDLKEEWEFDESFTDTTETYEISNSSNSHQGYFVGNNSGQGMNGVGNANGQGGIIIGSNSGIGKRSTRRPFRAKPLVIFKPKPTMVIQEEETDSEQ